MHFNAVDFQCIPAERIAFNSFNTIHIPLIPKIRFLLAPVSSACRTMVHQLMRNTTENRMKSDPKKTPSASVEILDVEILTFDIDLVIS